jgi:hypothetical protein
VLAVCTSEKSIVESEQRNGLNVSDFFFKKKKRENKMDDAAERRIKK